MVPTGVLPVLRVSAGKNMISGKIVMRSEKQVIVLLIIEHSIHYIGLRQAYGSGGVSLYSDMCYKATRMSGGGAALALS